MLSHATVPFDRNPSLRPGLAALVEWLMDSDFNAHAIGRIFDYVAVNGTPTGSPELPAEDEAAATAVFCDGLDAVPYGSAAWDHDDVILDARLLADGVHPWPMPLCPPELEPEDFDGPDAPDAGMSRSAALGELLRTGSVSALPSISGGSDEAAPFEPSEADWADYRAWSEELDRRRNAADRHSPDALARIHRVLYGRSDPFHA